MQAHVLIVDDDEAMRESLVFSLQRENKWWKLSVADGVEQARQVLESPPEDHGPVDVVLTDLVMEKPTAGIDVLEIAKRVDPFTMVIVFTAQEKNLDRFEAYKHGAYDCVEKNMIGKRAWKEISVKANAAIEFRRLAQSHLESQKKLGMLESFFDPRVFESVKQDRALLQVRMRDVTVAFWDIRGFSGICNRLSANPEVLREFMFEYYNLATSAIFSNHGIVDKMIGDGVMALFFPLRAEDDDGAQGAFHAVSVALDLRQRFERLASKWQGRWNRQGEPPLEVALGCGIDTGKSLVGSLGAAHREQFTALGPHVNFAARLESLARAGQILVSKQTAQWVARRGGLGGWEIKGVGYVSNIKNMPGKHAVYEVRAQG